MLVWAAVMVVPLIFGAITATVRAIRLWWNDPIPTIDISEFDRRVEIEGKATPLAEPIEAEGSGTECLIYTYERRQRTDDAEWKRVDHGRSSVPFLLEDAYGQVAVDPTNARLEIDTVYEESQSEGETTTKITEKRLDSGQAVHITGRTQQQTDRAVGRELFVGSCDNPVTVREGTERETIRKNALNAVFFLIAGTIMFEVLIGQMFFDRFLTPEFLRQLRAVIGI